jgi:prophage tail gpP-like protein
LPLASIDNPELGSLTILLPGSGVQFDNFLAYEYNESFTTPSDSFWFELDEDELSEETKAVLIPGAGVRVSIDDQPQVAGFIDDIQVRAGRGGTIWHMECRDWLSPAVDGHIDPKVQFKQSQTLDQLLTTVFEPFGVSVFSTDNSTNRNIITGRVYGNPSSKKGKPLKSYVLHETKPYQHEGAFAFASRICQRFGLWLWPASDGQTLIVGKPDFDQDPRYELRHVVDLPGDNNVVESSFKLSRTNQPAIIYASGFGGGGSFAKATLRAGIVNPIVHTDVMQIAASYPNVPMLIPPNVPPDIPPYIDPNARPLFLYDPESRTLEQLYAFLMRELALKMRSSLSAHYTIEGHRLNGQPIAVDTVMQVEDDRSNWHAPLWVIGRTFSKVAGQQGTRTRIEMIRLGTLQF